MIIRQKNFHPAPSAAGFSMIDVLVAIVVLATALLALAALQGALTRNAADARSRSQIAAYTEGLVDQLKAAGFGNIAAGTINPVCTGTPTKQQIEACAAQTAAGVTNLTTTITSSPYYSSAPTTGVFTQTSTAPATVFGAYDQVKVTTTWTDASGQTRTFAMDTIVSPVQVDPNNKSLDSTQLTTSVGSKPIVRQYNPGLTAGVIPIAMGSTGNSTAATNPQPEILGKNNNQFIGAVSYNVLTFGADDGTANHETQITQNIATRVVRCSCKYGAQVTTGVFAQPYRPTYWDASQKVYVSPAKAVGSASTTGQDSSATQDTNCDVCCRDRNDTGASGEIRFNPWNTSDNSHYRYVNSTDTTPTVVDPTDHANAFVNACRLIIVDGVFDVATDMQNYFFGLVGTDQANIQKVPSGSNSTNTASSPLPTSTYSDDYKAFVKTYLLETGGGSTATAGAAPFTTSTVLTSTNYPLNSPSSTASTNAAGDLYATNGLAASGVGLPANIDITYVDPGKNNTAACIPSGTQDCRYLHARGLYVDHLEAVTLTALNSAISTCPANTTTALEGCVLPLLPFTTINITQLAEWSEEVVSGKDVTVTNTALTGGDPDQPLRGVVSALSTGSNNTKDKVVATIGLSNSGIIGTLNQWPISPTEAATTYPSSVGQQFTLTTGGIGAANTLDFDIILTGGAVGTGANTPSVGWAGNSTYYTSGSAVSTMPCQSGTSPNVLQTYVGTTTKKCASPVANLITATGVPSGSTAGVSVIAQNYNVQTPGTGGTGAGCTTKSGSTTIQPTNTTCSVYTVSSVAVNGTAVPGWTSALSATGTNSVYGLSATSTITVPSGLSSTSATTPDLLTITLAADATHSYTMPYTCLPTTCTGAKGNKCTFTAGACNP